MFLVDICICCSMNHHVISSFYVAGFHCQIWLLESSQKVTFQGNEPLGEEGVWEKLMLKERFFFCKFGLLTMVTERNDRVYCNRTWEDLLGVINQCHCRRISSITPSVSTNSFRIYELQTLPEVTEILNKWEILLNVLWKLKFLFIINVQILLLGPFF